MPKPKKGEPSFAEVRSTLASEKLADAIIYFGQTCTALAERYTLNNQSLSSRRLKRRLGATLT